MYYLKLCKYILMFLYIFFTLKKRSLNLIPFFYTRVDGLRIRDFDIYGGVIDTTFANIKGLVYIILFVISLFLLSLFQTSFEILPSLPNAPSIV